MKKIVSTLLTVVLVVLFSIFGGPGEETAQPELQQEIQVIETEASVEAAAPEETEAQPQAPPETEAPAVTEAVPETEAPTEAPTEALIDPDGSYTSKEDVALYIHTYGCLPKNFMTKNEARKLGWEGGGLEKFAPGMCIGGDRFGNYEGLLPEDRDYTECDIDTLGKKSRGAKRIVFSEDGLIYYTDDHYETFELLYGEP